MEATSGPHSGITYTLTVGSTACFVGRSSGKKFREKGISLPKDNEVSTTHAKIELQRDAVVLVDVGSTNGTTLDGEAVEEAKPRVAPRRRSRARARRAARAAGTRSRPGRRSSSARRRSRSSPSGTCRSRRAAAPRPARGVVCG